MEDCYHSRCVECVLIARRDEQTIFGRTKNIVSFTQTFYKEVFIASGKCTVVSEGQVADAQLDDLVQWDSETWIGEAFWSSVWQVFVRLITDGEDREGVHRVLQSSGGSITDTPRTGEKGGC